MQSNKIIVLPGSFYVTQDSDLVLHTLLGSCVAACLYDPSNRVAGMNHFLLAYHRFPRKAPLITAEAGRYGVQAMELLINALLKLGAEKSRLRAKIFGGAAVFKFIQPSQFLLPIGEINNRFIREFMRIDHIQVVGESLGGEVGRVIEFHTSDYSVQERLLQKTEYAAIISQDEKLWQTEYVRNVTPQSPVEIWPEKH